MSDFCGVSRASGMEAFLASLASDEQSTRSLNEDVPAQGHKAPAMVRPALRKRLVAREGMVRRSCGREGMRVGGNSPTLHSMAAQNHAQQVRFVFVLCYSIVNEPTVAWRSSAYSPP